MFALGLKVSKVWKGQDPLHACLVLVRASEKGEQWLLASLCCCLAAALPAPSCWLTGSGASGGLTRARSSALVEREGTICYCRDWKLPDVIITCSDGGYFYYML